MANMVDVSSWNHPGGKAIPWSVLREHYGIRAAMIKSSEDPCPANRFEGYVNPYLVADVDGCAAGGVLRGYYHFAHPGHRTPEQSVETFAKTIAGHPHEVGLALDLEVSEGLSWATLAEWGARFLELLSEHAEWTIFYTNRSWHNALSGSPFGHRLWLASPGARPREQVWAWQYGISTDGLLSGFDVDELHELPAAAA